MSGCGLSRDVPRCEATCRAALGTEESRRVPLRRAACARWTCVPRARDRPCARPTHARTAHPQDAHRFQTPFPPPAARAPTLRRLQASISSSTSGRHARSDRGAAPAPPFHRARSAARSRPRATTSSGTPASDQRPSRARSRGPSASPRPRTTAKSTSTRSAKLEVGGRRLIPHLHLTGRPAGGWARLTSRQEVEDDAAATPKKFPTRSMACPLACSPATVPGHKGPESTSSCDDPSSFS
jgi:hypothetical protein